MISTRDIQRKIRAVRSIQQITRAMKTVSSIKLRRAEERLQAARPYAEALRDLARQLGGEEAAHPLLEVREERRVGVVAISGDKGLAGSYNANLIRRASAEIRARAQAEAVPVGRKIVDAFRNQGFPVELSLPLLGAEPDFRRFAVLADQVGARYARGVWDAVDLMYTTVGGRVVIERLLPILPEEDATAADRLYVPNAATLREQLLPRYLRVQVYAAALTASVAEHAARVMAMTLATENAADMITQLTMEYNKARQATITSELVDIIGAVEALT